MFEEQRLAAVRTLADRIIDARRLARFARARLLACIPSLDPTGGSPIASGFGYRTSPSPEFHEGVDLDADYGTPVKAAAGGVVASAGWDGGYGLKVDIDHQNGYHTWYAHLSSLAVSAGDQVVRGTPVGAVGNTGDSTGPHLHYQIMYQGTPVDPEPFLHGVPANVLASIK